MMKRFEKTIVLLFLVLILFSCNKQNQSSLSVEDFIETLVPVKSSTDTLSYAKLFSIQKYSDKSNNIYSLITVENEGKFFLVPEKYSGSIETDEMITVINKPLDKTYLVSSSVMDFVCKIGALKNIKFSGLKQKDWNIESAVTAMENGSMKYAGKYSSPDYDLLINEGCNFALENTMIYHNPDVKEKLLELGIPVFIERSNYETHPLGRLEWIKLYGLLFDMEEQAYTYFENQIQKISEILNQENTGLDVLFFYVNTNGIVNVRKPGDYISKTIKLAGANYILDSIFPANDNALSSVNMQFEDFYTAGYDADIIIYNGTIDTTVKSKDDLLYKNPLFGDFTAFKNNKVYCAEKKFFQETTGIADFMKDMNKIFNDDDENLVYLKKLK